MTHLNENFDIEDHVLKHYNGMEESVRIPDSVTAIGDTAFLWCTTLKSIIIPESVTRIGDGAFTWCDHLTEIVLPDSITSIGNGALFKL